MLPRMPKPMKPRFTRSLGLEGLGTRVEGKGIQLPFRMRPRPAVVVALWSMNSRRVDFDMAKFSSFLQIVLAPEQELHRSLLHSGYPTVAHEITDMRLQE